MSDEPHSAAYFGDQRNFWWNEDFLGLMAGRLGLAKVSRALDAGSGLGHWTRALLPSLPRATVVGIDRERRWVEQASHWAAHAGLSGRVRFDVGDVTSLPFDDGTFDLVTCQTVLIHVRDVDVVLREFLRVLAPGGRLLVAEPNNLAGSLCVGSARGAALASRLALLEFQAICEQGKVALGEGDNSVGDLLPGKFANAGLIEVNAWTNDRANCLIPPYVTPSERAQVDDLMTFDANDFWIWSRADTERYFLAGGGTPNRFESLWSTARASLRSDVAAVRAGSLHQAGGGVTYLVTGVRPIGHDSLPHSI